MLASINDACKGRMGQIDRIALSCWLRYAKKKKTHIDSTHVPSDTRDEGVDACHRSNMFVNEIPSSPDTVLIN